MTPTESKELLEKYGLKADVKSIRERIEKDSYFQDLIGVLHIPHNEMLCDVGWGKLNNARSICRTADLSVLCSITEKGERETELLNLYRKFFKESEICIEHDSTDIDDLSTDFEYVSINNEKTDVETVRKIQELEAEGETK